MSIKIYCYKSFSKYFNLEVEANIQQENNINEWTAHFINFDKKKKVLLFNHKTFLYVVLDDVKKSDIENFSSTFLDNLLIKVERDYKLSEKEMIVIKDKFKQVSFYDKSKNGNLNFVINNYISVLKNSELLGYTSFEEFYSEEIILDDDTTVQKFITELKK